MPKTIRNKKRQQQSRKSSKRSGGVRQNKKRRRILWRGGTRRTPYLDKYDMIEEQLKETCSICLDPMDLDTTQNPRTIRCGYNCNHIFHTKCIYQHVIQQDPVHRNPSNVTCPMCREFLAGPTSVERNGGAFINIPDEILHLEFVNRDTHNVHEYNHMSSLYANLPENRKYMTPRKHSNYDDMGL